MLEGEEELVEPLYRKILIDKRHEDVQLLAMNDLAAVMFRDAPMKLIDGSQSRYLQDRFIYDDLREGGTTAANKAAFQLLKL